MATLNVRLDDELKSNVFDILGNLGITPTEAIRLYFRYIEETGTLPIKPTVISDEEAVLLDTVRHRLTHPEKPIRVTLDEL